MAQVVLSFGRGGLETLAVRLACALTARGIRSVLIALDEGGDLETPARQADVEVHIVGGRRLRDPRFHWRFARLVRGVAPTVLHSHNFAALLHTAVARRVAGVPRFVHTEHAFEYLAEQPHYWRWLRVASREPDPFVVVGARLRPFFEARGVSPDRLRVITNGVDLDTFRPPNDRGALRNALGLPPGFLIGTAGRFAPEKDYPTLIRALAGVCRTRRDAQLILLGDGVERAALADLARALGIADRVHFPGWRQDVAAVLAALDVFVLTSLNEGLPLALLEAMAAGVPAVATGVGEIPLVIEDGVTGRLIPVGDQSALTNILVALGANPDDRASLGAAGRQTVRAGFSHDAMVDRYLSAYGIAPSVEAASERAGRAR